MVITNQVVKATITEIKNNPVINETRPVVNIQNNSISPVIVETPVRPNIIQSAINVSITETPVHVSIPVGIQGEKGEKGDTGPSGASSSYIYTAGEILGGHRAIIIDNNLAYYADCTNLSHINKPIGISNNASALGGEVTVVFFGEMEEVSWNWDIDKPIWISTNGLLTQTTPVTGFLCIIAFPVTATKIFIDKQEILITN